MTATFLRYPFGSPVETGRNLVPNPSIEVDTTSYTAITGSPTLSRSSLVGAFHGTYALRVLMSGTTTTDTQIDYNYITVLPSTQYTFSFYTRAGTNARNVTAIIRFYDAVGVQVGSTTFGTTAANTNTGWTRFTVTATSGVGAVRCSPILRVSTPANGESHYFDGIMLNTGATPLTYFDGSFPNVGLTTFYRWLGTANQSVSVEEGPGAADFLTPTLGILKPWQVTREARSIARPLMESEEVRTVIIPAGPRKGTISAVFDDSADAMDALDYFSAASVYHVTDEAYATMWFAVTDGESAFVQDVAPGQVTIPFTKIPEPT